MLIIGCDYHPSFQQIAWVKRKAENAGNSNYSTAMEKRRSFTAI